MAKTNSDSGVFKGVKTPNSALPRPPTRRLGVPTVDGSLMGRQMISSRADRSVQELEQLLHLVGLRAVWTQGQKTGDWYLRARRLGNNSFHNNEFSPMLVLGGDKDPNLGRVRWDELRPFLNELARAHLI